MAARLDMFRFKENKKRLPMNRCLASGVNTRKTIVSFR